MRRTESFADEAREKSGTPAAWVWGPYGYIYEKERGRLAKIEKIPAGPEKTLIFFVKNDTLRKSTQSIALLLSAFV